MKKGYAQIQKRIKGKNLQEKNGELIWVILWKTG
jgi:hypothetical protein